MVKRIDEINPQLKFAFAFSAKRQRKILLNRKVKELLHRSPQVHGAWSASQRAFRWTHERSRIQIWLAKGTNGAFVRVARVFQGNAGHDVETNRAVRSTQPVSVGDEGNRRLAALHAEHSGQCPATHDRIDRARCMTEECPSFPHRYVPNGRGVEE